MLRYAEDTAGALRENWSNGGDCRIKKCLLPAPR